MKVVFLVDALPRLISEVQHVATPEEEKYLQDLADLHQDMI